MNKEAKIVEVDGTKFYAFEARYFENEYAAEMSGYYWHDEIGKWVKEIADNTTTIF